jgi:hypothetical protein
MLLVSLVPALFSGSIGAHIAGWILFGGFGILWIRGLRAGIRAETDVLIVRTPLRTRKVLWSDIAAADVVPTNGNRIFGIVRITMRNRRRMKIDGTGNRWRRGRMEDTAVGQVTADINRRVADKGAP